MGSGVSKPGNTSGGSKPSRSSRSKRKAKSKAKSKTRKPTKRAVASSLTKVIDGAKPCTSPTIEAIKNAVQRIDWGTEAENDLIRQRSIAYISPRENIRRQGQKPVLIFLDRHFDHSKSAIEEEFFTGQYRAARILHELIEDTSVGIGNFLYEAFSLNMDTETSIERLKEDMTTGIRRIRVPHALKSLHPDLNMILPEKWDKGVIQKLLIKLGEELRANLAESDIARLQARHFDAKVSLTQDIAMAQEQGNLDLVEKLLEDFVAELHLQNLVSYSPIHFNSPKRILKVPALSPPSAFLSMNPQLQLTLLEYIANEVSCVAIERNGAYVGPIRKSGTVDAIMVGAGHVYDLIKRFEEISRPVIVICSEPDSVEYAEKLQDLSSPMLLADKINKWENTMHARGPLKANAIREALKVQKTLPVSH